MSDETPDTPQCRVQRALGTTVASRKDGVFESWPGNFKFTTPLQLNPNSLAELANAILQAEHEGHHVRAYGSKWSFSDAVYAGSPDRPGAMIVTEQLKKSLQSELPYVLAAGVDPTFLCYVEAGIKSTDLTFLLAGRGQTLEAGGGSGQSIAGMMSTSTHSGDSLVPPLVDYIRAIHLVGAGGIEHWIEPDSRITDPAKLQSFYPCLATGNIHYNTALFNAVLVSAGSMGVVYSVILKTVPQYGVHQHRVATTWEALLKADPDLTKVIDGTYLASWNQPPLKTDIFGVPITMAGPFAPNTFSQIVINPYPFYGNDDTLTVQEKSRVGEHLCFVTNRVKIPIPTNPFNPKTPDDFIKSLGNGMGTAARNSLGGGPDGPGNDLRFLLFKESQKNETDLSKSAAALVDLLADNYQPGTISALIHFVLRSILPVEDRFDLDLSEVVVWGNRIRSFCVEASFTTPCALAFVPQVLALVAAHAARRPHIYIGGYLALRFVGKKTDALLGMQRWSPTCSVEYLGLTGSRGIDEFVDDLQKLALAYGGILHFGLQNNVMTAANLSDAFGPANIEAFRRARGILSQNATLSTFDNSFTDRLGLSALPATSDQLWHNEQKAVGVSAPWTDWHELSRPGNKAKVLALAAHADGRMHAVMAGVDDQIWHNEQQAVGVSAPWTDWHELSRPGNKAKVLALAGHANVPLHVVIVGDV